MKVIQSILNDKKQMRINLSKIATHLSEMEMSLLTCLLEAGLARAGDHFRWADPRPFLAAVHPRVVIVHGRDDDVIPWSQALALEAALPPSHPREVIFTGLYGHTGAAVPSPSAIAGEVRALTRVVHQLATAPEVTSA